MGSAGGRGDPTIEAEREAPALSSRSRHPRPVIDHQSVAAFKQSMALLGAVDRLTEVGIVVSDYKDHITPKDQTVAVEELRETGLLLTPLVPARSIVPKARLACDWLGRYEKGEPVATAYADLAGLIFERITA